jgi:hypothetical protein
MVRRANVTPSVRYQTREAGTRAGPSHGRDVTEAPVSPLGHHLIEYRALGDRRVQETLWNSRDGLVPKTIVTRTGHFAKLYGARHAPEHVPQVGERILVDLVGIERILEFIGSDDSPQWSDVPASERWRWNESEDEFLADLLAHYERESQVLAGIPVTVSEEMAREEGWL